MSLFLCFSEFLPLKLVFRVCTRWVGCQRWMISHIRFICHVGEPVRKSISYKRLSYILYFVLRDSLFPFRNSHFVFPTCLVVRGGWSLTFGSYVTLANLSENLFPITAPPLPLHFNRLTLVTASQMMWRRFFCKLVFLWKWIWLGPGLENKIQDVFPKDVLSVFSPDNQLKLGQHRLDICYTQEQSK